MLRLPTHGLDLLCVHHLYAAGDDWAMGNRIMCDLIHRGLVSPTLPEPVRSDAGVVAWAA